MNTDDIQAMAKEAVEKFLSEHEAEKEAKRLAAEPSAEQKQAQKLNEANFREAVTDAALCHGVIPRSIRHVLRDAETVFELRDGAIVPKGGRTDPGDPLQPLTIARWLQLLAKTDANLFAPPEQVH